MNFYDYEAEDARCNVVKMDDYKGKVVLVVNTATRCGFTPQYDDFPCNQFGNQAPGTTEEIASFCDAKFGITFKLFSKIEVNGENAHPLYKYLKEQKGFGGFDPNHPLTPLLESGLYRTQPDFRNTPDIKWNFTKFLIDRDGNVVERFEPTADMDVVEEKIREIL